MKISIITATFNSCSSLITAIESVISQQFTNIEYIFVDGGSDDGSLEIIQKYAAADPRIRWISGPDSGISDAFNKGLKMATGDWVGILNSDDSYAPGAFTTVAEIIRNCPGADIIHGDIVRCDENGHPLFVLTPVDIEDVIWRQMPLNHPATFVSRKAYQEVGDFNVNLKVAMDYELILRMYLAGKNFYYIRKVLANMSYGGASDEKFIDVRREVYGVTVAHGYPKAKALFCLYDHILRGLVKIALRRLGLYSLLRVHPRFRKGAV